MRFNTLKFISVKSLVHVNKPATLHYLQPNSERVIADILSNRCENIMINWFQRIYCRPNHNREHDDEYNCDVNNGLLRSEYDLKFLTVYVLFYKGN